MARQRFQFGLRFLFAAIAFVAVSVWGARKLAEWSASVPLAAVIDSFNARIENDQAQSLGPNLTEKEVLGAVRFQSGIVARQPGAKATCEYILRTKRVPRGARISIVKSQSQTPMGPDWVRFVSLDVITQENRHCSLTIRQVNNGR
jgi:hypothetical protein